MSFFLSLNTSSKKHWKYEATKEGSLQKGSQLIGAIALVLVHFMYPIDIISWNMHSSAASDIHLITKKWKKSGVSWEIEILLILQKQHLYVNPGKWKITAILFPIENSGVFWPCRVNKVTKYHDQFSMAGTLLSLAGFHIYSVFKIFLQWQKLKISSFSPVFTWVTIELTFTQFFTSTASCSFSSHWHWSDIIFGAMGDLHQKQHKINKQRRWKTWLHAGVVVPPRLSYMYLL